MSYIESNLQMGEEIVYKAKLHFFLFVQPIVFLLLSWWLYGSEIDVVRYGSIFLLIIGVISLLQLIMVKIGSVYVVTNKRVILKTGVINRNVLDLVLTKCEGLQIKQSVWGRIFGFGTITVTTGGVTISYPFVSNPQRFRKEINQQIG